MWLRFLKYQFCVIPVRTSPKEQHPSSFIHYRRFTLFKLPKVVSEGYVALLLVEQDLMKLENTEGLLLSLCNNQFLFSSMMV